MKQETELLVELATLSGTYNEIGEKQGSNTVQDDTFSIIRDMTQGSDVAKAKASLTEWAPFLLEELKGAAYGLGMQEDEVIQRYSGFDIAFPQMGCTAFANQHFYARNYDFSPELYDARFVFCRPDNGYASAGFSQQMVGRLDGINEKGLVIGLHLVNGQKSQPGFIGTTLVRMVLDQCATVSEAVSLLAKAPHGFCYNYSIMDQTGASVIVEASPEHQTVRTETSLACTNHFETGSQKKNNRQETGNSKQRLAYLATLSKQQLTPLQTYRLFNQTDSPLFAPYYQDYFGTMHTVIYDPANVSMIIGIGGNCEPYYFSLKNWLHGDAVLPAYMKGVVDLSR